MRGLQIIGSILLCLLLVQFGIVQPVSAASFQGLGHLPEGDSSYATSVSADGSVVVGQSASALGDQAFRWTSGGGMVGLGDLSGGEFDSVAQGASADGSVVVGFSDHDNHWEAFRWTSGGGMVGLGDLSGGTVQSHAFGVSADGSVVVGRSISDLGYEAFRWTSGGGMVGLGDLEGEYFQSIAFGVSADGSVVVGEGSSDSGLEAFRWTSGGGMVGLGYLDLESYSRANDVSADGSAVVGGSDFEAFRWTSGEGMVGLGDLCGGGFIYGGSAYGVSADGSVVVGWSNCGDGGHAFIWDSTNGMRNLQDVLENDFGLDLTGWTLGSANDISDDGSIIVGSGTNPLGEAEAWIADLSDSSIDSILAFFDDSVDDLSLTGYGSGNSADGRLNALRNMLEMAGDLINMNDIESACGQLEAASRKCDGESPPPDFVTGTAAGDLYDMILELIAELGCE